jgi:galactose-1-phosphate uridylyltransferase
MEASRVFYQKNGVSYWDDIVDAEKENEERFITELGGSRWMTSFCGLGNNDVMGVVDASNILELGEGALGALSEGLSTMLRGYHTIGVQGFNMSLFSGPLETQSQHFNVHIRMISRPDVRPMYTSDAGFMERLHDEVVVETKPEDVALKMRAVSR